MTLALMPEARQRYYSNVGLPLAGGKVYTYAAGTSTPKATYQDAAGTVPHPNPIVLDAKGEALIYWSGAYKVDVKTSIGVQITGYPVDNYVPPMMAADLSGSSGSGLIGFLYSTAYSVGTIGRWLKDLATSTGSSFIGFIQAGTGAQPRTSEAKQRERVSVADFLTTAAPTADQATAALQAAISSGAKRVFISANYSINGPITLVANQILDFDGGSLTVAAGTVAANGILYGNAITGSKIIDPILDASATSGIAGINFLDCPGACVIDGLLTECNLAFTASSNAVRMGYKARGTVVNMNGWANVACYVSGANKVSLIELELFGGKEGVGIYNDARHVKLSHVDSHNHTQDGFVVIAGQRVDYSGCMAYSNGQSGFTTQRQTAAENTKRVTYNGCHAYDNAFDGFDLRGALAVSFGSDMLVTVTGCISAGNTRAGFYVVLAEGTQLVGCQAYSNLQQNFFVDTSERVQLIGCRSGSGASAVASGVNRAGIIVYNANYVTIEGCQSSNSNGATQEYGVVFTGSSAYGQVIGGYYENNITLPYYMQSNRLVGAQANTLGGVFLNEISYTGTYYEDGIGVPTHTRPKGSVFVRIDGGLGEFYVSNGAGSWTAH